MIQKVLRDIAKNHKLFPQVVIQEFAEGSLNFVDEFWIKIYEIYGDKYNDVYRRPDCKKFELDHFEDKVKISKYLQSIDNCDH
ncbi:hypothetical protein fh0823_24570 [Francisella halioticida]|uniref:Uncharacterized protein n=1 Tax=Francisella halioticida TaxID=549298 RepID=A0ABM6LWE3_9GAMM|nr:hypothetical protein [Francisella halioticida]ASG66990.1 hypothetical protein CDV26_00050 [Francisella halioticida]BCD92241.1 hypothetical protein fh0823_23800 [Francisella halioticida]BCD92318.1 hypothetical protein fh0823_24570 [Francisella halioticida]